MEWTQQICHMASTCLVSHLIPSDGSAHITHLLPKRICSIFIHSRTARVCGACVCACASVGGWVDVLCAHISVSQCVCKCVCVCVQHDTVRATLCMQWWKHTSERGIRQTLIIKEWRDGRMRVWRDPLFQRGRSRGARETWPRFPILFLWHLTVPYQPKVCY